MKHFKSADFATVTEGETYMVLSENASINLSSWSFTGCDTGQTQAEVIEYLLGDCSDRFFVICINPSEKTCRNVTEDVVRKCVAIAAERDEPLSQLVYDAAVYYKIDAQSPDEWEDASEEEYRHAREHERLEGMGRL
jgi:hypothetical protein